MIDELTLLRDAWQDEPPAPMAEARARAALLDRASRTNQRRVPAVRPRLGPRLAVAGVAAVVAAAGVAWYQGGGQGGRTSTVRPPVPVTPVLERAALAAATRPFTQPRPDQWVYIKVRTPAGHDLRSWHSVDGRSQADYVDGKLEVHTLPARVVVYPPDDYFTLDALPRDPHALVDWARGLVNRPPFAPPPDLVDARVFETLIVVLRDNVLPPDLQAALFRAIATVPGVTQTTEPIVVDGRQVLAPACTFNGWLREEILLDPRTYDVVGDRSVAVADHTGESDPGVTGTVKRGDLVEQSIRTVAKFVDGPGQT